MKVLNKSVLKALCYPNKPKDVPLDILVALARADGKRISKDSNVQVVDRLWSDICQFWVVIIEIKER